MVYSRENDDSTIVQDVMLRHHIASLNRRVIQYQENDTENLHTDTVNETVNSQIMEFFNISESTAKQATRDLKKPGYIERKDSDKTGYWVILK